LRWGKRVLDTFIAGISVLIALPLLAACAVAVRLGSPGPIFFRQWRVGQYGRAIRVFKFRSMVHNPQFLGLSVSVAGDLRITSVGRLLRRLKFDEFPQLFNVLRGDMSLVGPRPELAEYVALYTFEQKRVLQLKPGITSAASIANTDEELELAQQPDPKAFYTQVLMPRKLNLDLAYLSEVSLKRDLILILETAAKIWAKTLRRT
jgi:lipopolysaccharide/colanic/teichoic acid biosynthesis glycosyltransferase